MQLALERTRIHVDGVRGPISADVARRRDDGMVVMQPLPFLKLDTTVTEQGRRSRIRRVAIAMDGDVPRLLLELSHDRPALEDDTLESFTPGVSTRPARTDSTVPYEFASRDEETSREPIVVGTPTPAETPSATPAAALAVAPPEGFWARLWRAALRALATITAPASS